MFSSVIFYYLLCLQEATANLQSAEAERFVLEEKLRLKNMATSVRLGRPLLQRDPNPFVTHRGLGAFTEAEFQKDPDSPRGFRPPLNRTSSDISDTLSISAKNLNL